LSADKSYSEHFVLTLFHKEKGILYAVTGGLGYSPIQEFADNDFGIDVFSRLLKKEDKILKGTREKGFGGSVLGRTEYFRRQSNLHEIDSFGKIYQELKASLRKDILVDKMGLSIDQVKKDSVCIAKSSFRINKAITFPELLKVIEGCESILETEEPVPINDVERITAKQNKPLIDQLDAVLFDRLWERYLAAKNAWSFDLCDSNFEGYLTASKYIVRKGISKSNLFEFEELINIDSLFEKILVWSKRPTTQEAFVKLVKSLKISSYDDNNVRQTHRDLLSHLMGDVADNAGKKYFFIDKTWLRIKDTFIENLNQRCKNFIDAHAYNVPERWNYPHEQENDYNRKFIGRESCVVLDRVTPENIEPCDILQWDKETLYLIHVKASFGNMMRDLCSQVLISASRISQAVSRKDFIEKIYNAMQSKIGAEDPYFEEVGRQSERLTKEEFIALFEKKLVFVLAILDTGEKERRLSNITEFNSNIAKFSLQELTRNMRGLDVELRIAQILRPDSPADAR